MIALVPEALPRPDGLADPVASSLFEASSDCVKVVDLNGALVGMNVNGLCLMEIDDFEDVRGRPWPMLWPEAGRLQIEAALDAARLGKVSRITAECPTAKGAMKTWDVTVAPVLDATGQPISVVSISRDVTAERSLEAENTLLIRELAHRIKNMFAVVDGVISLSARATDAARPFADTLRQRVNALGRAVAYVSPPDLLGREDGKGHTLHGLLKVLLEPYGAIEGGGLQIAITGEDHRVGRGATTALALVINELATNSMKYGALRAEGGRVELRTSLTNDDVNLCWNEQLRDVQPPAQATEGFGTTLLENAVRRQLRGEITRTFDADGLKVSITAPRSVLIL